MGIPTLYRYIMREIMARFLAIIIILLSIILSFRLSRLLSAAVNGDVALDTVWQLIGLKSVYILAIIIPIAFVLSTVMTISRLYRQHEMSAVFAGGIGRAHIHHIVLLLAIFIAALLLILNLQILPEVYRKHSALRNQAHQQAGFALLTENNFQRLDDGVTIHTGEQKDGKYNNFFIEQRETGKNPQSSVIFAEKGSIIKKADEQYLILEDGIRASWRKADSIESTNYTEFKQAELHIPSPPASSSNRVRNIPTAELKKTKEHLAEWQNRLNPVIALLIFSLSLPMVAHSTPRREKQYKFLPAFLIFIAYISILEAVVKNVSKGSIAILPGSFAVHFCILFAIFLWWLKARKQL